MCSSAAAVVAVAVAEPEQVRFPCRASDGDRTVRGDKSSVVVVKVTDSAGGQQQQATDESGRGRKEGRWGNMQKTKKKVVLVLQRK